MRVCGADEHFAVEDVDRLVVLCDEHPCVWSLGLRVYDLGFRDYIWG